MFIGVTKNVSGQRKMYINLKRNKKKTLLFGQRSSLYHTMFLCTVSLRERKLPIALHCLGSLGIAPTRNCTCFLKIGFVVAGGVWLPGLGFIPITIDENIIATITNINTLLLIKLSTSYNCSTF